MKWIDNNKIIDSNIKIITNTLSISSLVFSLTYDCYCTSGSCGDSLTVFIFGILGLYQFGASICWLANPLLIFSWFTIKRTKVSFIFSLCSSILAISFLFFDEVMINEAGHYGKVTSYELGYWLWVLSSLIMLMGNGMILYKNKDVIDQLDDGKVFKYKIKVGKDGERNVEDGGRSI